MAIFRVTRRSEPGDRIIDGITGAIVEAANSAAAIAAAEALDTRFDDYFTATNATTTDLSTPGNFTGSLIGDEQLQGTTS